MNKTALDQVLAKGVAPNEAGKFNLPGAVYMAADLKKNAYYAQASGVRSLDPKGVSEEVEIDTVCFMASMTKFMTSISAMQCVERGLIGLDDDVSTVLHSWKDAEILEGFDDSGKAILKKAKNKITLRTLLSHSSGIGYDVFYPKLIKWRQSVGQDAAMFSGDVEKGFKFPLLAEPGEGWFYGAGIDWAGKLVEALNGNIRLGDYMQKNIWEPLGMTSTTFNIETNPAKSRLADMTLRTPTGDLKHLPAPIFNRQAKDDCGGIGGYSTAPDYMKMLLSILRDDGKLLKSSTIDEMFRPQLKDPEYMTRLLTDQAARNSLMGALPEGTRVTYGLGGMINLDESSLGRSADSMQWGGLPNLFWWIDRKNRVCGTYFTQLLPSGDPAALKIVTELERAVYGRDSKAEQKL